MFLDDYRNLMKRYDCSSKRNVSDSFSKLCKRRMNKLLHITDSRTYLRGKEMDFNTLIKNNILDNKEYAEVIQVILLNNKEREYWNYFTHIYFSGKIKETSERVFLTQSPQP